jgi:hypothetical protein
MVRSEIVASHVPVLLGSVDDLIQVVKGISRVSGSLRVDAGDLLLELVVRGALRRETAGKMFPALSFRTGIFLNPFDLFVVVLIYLNSGAVAAGERYAKVGVLLGVVKPYDFAGSPGGQRDGWGR